MQIRHHIFEPNPTGKYEIAILIKDTCFNTTELSKYYVEPLVQLGISRNEIIAFNLEYSSSNKVTAKTIKEYLNTILKVSKSMGVDTLVVADPNYFKTLTKNRKADPHYGYVCACEYEPYTDMQIVLTLNFSALFYNPAQQTKIDRSLQVLADHKLRVALEPGANIIHSAEYPDNLKDIQAALMDLHRHKVLTIDIETYGLRFDVARVATISFCWNEHNGIAFKVFHDMKYIYETKRIYNAIRYFFLAYKGKCIYHNATFDIKIMIFELFMERDYFNTKGLLEGLDVMLKNTECTQLISYLATNTTAGNDLALKNLAAEFAGNYAIDVEDISKIPTHNLLEYNLIDGLSTWYVYKKFWPVLIADKQLRVYEEIFRPSLKTVIQMELTGMPMHMKSVWRTKENLELVQQYNLGILMKHQTTLEFTKTLQMEALLLKQSKLKKKQVTIDDFTDITFNPGSSKQVGKLLHDHMGIPISDTTPGGAPSVGADILEKHVNQLKSEFNITDEDLK